MKVDNAVIMAAGTATRFAPLSYEIPKALIEVRGEVLIERQIRQLYSAGIKEIVVVTGYKAELFQYLRNKYNVKLVYNPEYLIKNNNSSIYAVKKYLRNSYICSSDNYFSINPFKGEENESYYSAIYVEGNTKEWCIKEKEGWISDVKIGGSDSWIMMGHSFWTEEFSGKFISILEDEYDNPETADKLWETVYVKHISELPMKIRKYDKNIIFEFDTLDELRNFDVSYISDTRSSIIKKIVKELKIKESDIKKMRVLKGENNEVCGFAFNTDKVYKYYYSSQKLEEML